MQKQKKLVHSVGVNDADYPTRKYETTNGKCKVIWRCPFYVAWVNMLSRCYNPIYQAKYPTYIGCTVTPEWRNFSAFKSWMEQQPWEGNQLDKDILFPENKLYSPSACVFVPAALNKFLNDNSAAKGALPTGVHLHRGRYMVQCENPFTLKREFLGYHDSPAEAHSAWRKWKHELACRWADMQDDPRIAKALRERFA